MPPLTHKSPDLSVQNAKLIDFANSHHPNKSPTEKILTQENDAGRNVRVSRKRKHEEGHREQNQVDGVGEKGKHDVLKDYSHSIQLIIYLYIYIYIYILYLIN